MDFLLSILNWFSQNILQKTSVLCRYLGFNRIYSFEETLV